MPDRATRLNANPADFSLQPFDRCRNVCSTRPTNNKCHQHRQVPPVSRAPPGGASRFAPPVGSGIWNFARENSPGPPRPGGWTQGKESRVPLSPENNHSCEEGLSGSHIRTLIITAFFSQGCWPVLTCRLGMRLSWAKYSVRVIKKNTLPVLSHPAGDAFEKKSGIGSHAIVYGAIVYTPSNPTCTGSIRRRKVVNFPLFQIFDS